LLIDLVLAEIGTSSLCSIGCDGKSSASLSQSESKTLPDGRPAPVDPEAANRGEKEKFEANPNDVLAFAKELMKPISFWGKVIDQYGNPVVGADVSWGANNNLDPNKSGTRGQATSDANGLFSIASHGISLSVEVAKSGYHRVPTAMGGKRGSYGGFSNAERLGNTDSPMGTKDDPAIFVLQKMGETVSLVHISERSIKTAKDGSPVQVNLETGQTTGEGDLKVQCWTNDQSKDAQGHYNWKCILTVPGGGLVERNERFAFEAPSEGYQESVELTPSPEKWASNIERQYFVKLADNRYARINFRMRTGGEHFFVIESYFNPTPGSRNLEYDPAKTIKP
jgi:hypothetical protein